MASIDRLHQMQEDVAARGERKGWKERLSDMLSTEDGWKAFLDVIAEHPGMSARNAGSVVQYRLATGASDTQELLTYEQARELGGHVAKGAKGIPLSKASHDADGHISFETVIVFPAGKCVGLDEKRYRGRPRQVHPEVSESVDAFVQATEGIALESLSPVADYAFGRRYGLVDAADGLPPRPVADDAHELAARCGEVSRELGDVCHRVDRALKLQAHPEWADERDEALGIKPTREPAETRERPIASTHEGVPTPPQAQEAPAATAAGVMAATHEAVGRARADGPHRDASRSMHI